MFRSGVHFITSISDFKVMKAFFFANLKRLFRIEQSKELDDLGDQSCPPLLVTRAQARAVVAGKYS
jgi:hypothetical protein